MTWAKGRQLASVSKGSGTGATAIAYAYDMDGIRRSKTVGGVTTEFVTQSGLVARQSWSGNTIDFFYDAQQRPYAMIYKPAGGTSVTYYYLTNLQGDVIALLDESGSVVAEYEYGAWGDIRSITDGNGAQVTSSAHIASINPLRYRGYYYDTETGFYYLQSRYYDPVIKRFINADAAEYSAMAALSLYDTNLFAYCRNNPVNRFDDGGDLSLSNSAKIAIGIGAIVAGVIATAVTGGAAAAVLVASLKIAGTSAVVGAISGAGTSAMSHRASTGSWDGVKTALLTGAIDGACDGFMWGGITAGASFATVAAKGVRVQEIGRLNPSNKSGNGYLGVKYDIRKPNGKYTTKSIELHSPHSSAPHNVWHWQQNTWSNYNGISRVTGSSKHWTIWGQRM